MATDKTQVSRIVRMNDDGDAGGEKLGPGRGDRQRAAVVERKVQAAEDATDLAVLHFGLGHRGTEVDIPHRRPRRLVDLVGLPEPEE